MAGRPAAAVPNIFATEGTGTLNNIPLLDADFAFNVSQNNDSAIGYNNYALDTGVANAYVIALASPASAYVTGMTLTWIPLNTNTAASVINIGALGSVSIVNPAGQALKGGEIIANSALITVFDGTSMRIVGPCALTQFFASTTQVVTVNCAGYNTIGLQINWTGAPAGMTLSLINLQEGAQLNFVIFNGTSAGKTFGMSATDAAGMAYTVIDTIGSGVVGGSTIVSLVSTGVFINSGLGMFFTGNVVSSGVMWLTH
jgi:hypothetical protein